MFQVDNINRPSPSPSRSSIRSDSKACRQPRVIQVNRDVATMVESGRHSGGGGSGAEARVPDWEPFSAPHPHSAPHPAHFRSRTFSDGFIPNTSQELLLGVDCDACLALASQRHCANEHISQHDFDLVCNCNIRQYNYLNYQPDIADQREHNLNIYDIEKLNRSVARPHMSFASHHSLDRKHTKSKTIGVSNYISKQLNSLDPANNLMQRIKRNLSNLKKLGGEAISKKHQNAVQLTELSSDSTNSLKKLSMMSLTDKNQRARKSRSYIFTSSDFHSKNDFKNNTPTYTNISGNVDQCIDRGKSCDFTMDRRPQGFKMRSFDNNDDCSTRNSLNCQRKFSTLDNRGRCRSIPRQMSYNDFTTERGGENFVKPWTRDDTEVTIEPREVEESSRQSCLDSDLVVLESTPRSTHCHCTCDPNQDKKFSSIFYDYQGEKRTPPAPDVTRRGPGAVPAAAAARSQPCRACKTAPWSSTGTTSSHSSTTTGNSSRFTVTHRRWCCVAVLVLVAGTACVAGPLALRAPPGTPLHERLRLAEQLLHETPLIDGHNDLPWNIRKFLHNRIRDFRFDEDLRTISPWATSSWSHTDLPRLKRGRISAQFWAAYVPCDAQHRDAVQLTFEQIDLIQRLTDKYFPQLTLCTSTSDIVAAHANHRMCSLIGVEGGHAIAGSLAVLRTLHQVGVRYLTLTSTCDTPWAECSSASEQDGWPHEGLTPFGKVVVKEMNRLGMLVDLSHVSVRTMRDALAVSRAPVLFSHSSARAICNATRNVPDVVLRLLAANKGLVMVNFYASFLTCRNTATVHDAIAHINHIRDVAGVDSVGLGAGFDGINYTPQGLEDVSSYPLLFAELMEAGWSMEELRKLAGLNLLRVLGAAERVSRELAAAQVTPYEDVPPRPPDPHNCSSQDL